MTRSVTLLIILVAIFSQISYGQQNAKKKRLKVKGVYIHHPTLTEFPEKIGEYQREEMYSFDKKAENIESTYEHDATKFTVYLYAAGFGQEGRLSGEFQ